MDLIEKNAMLEKLRAGKPVLICQLRSRSALIAEMLGYCGVDAVFIDGEHFPLDNVSVEEMIRAVQLGGAVPLVRLPSHDPGRILQTLEAGAMGIFFPHVDTPQQAKELAAQLKYSPYGNRGFSDASRAAKFGMMPVPKYQEYANRNIAFMPMIESLEGVNNIEGILDAKPDVVAIGGCDLSQDMGFQGVKTPEVKAQIAKVKAACKRRGIPCSGGSFDNYDSFKESIESGSLSFSATSDLVILRDALKEKVGRFEELYERLIKESER